MQQLLEPSEAEALDRAGGLLRFAAENKELAPEMVATICAAWEARQQNSWNHNIAKNFWLAFNSLCKLIRPVTMDTLSTNLREIPSPRWRLWNSEPLSLSRRSATRYLALLAVLLSIAVVLGFYISTATTLITSLNGQISTGDQVVEELNTLAASLQPISDKQFKDADVDKQKDIALVQAKVQTLYYALDHLAQNTKMLVVVIFGGLKKYQYRSGELNPPKNLAQLHTEMLNYYDARRNVAEAVLAASVSVAVVSSILPIFLGAMGACAYIVRLISEQIKETTFSTSSPVRHLVRLALGALAGVVIGFGGFSAGAGSLSPSALAFLAGYAVEPVFATFDGIAAKFRS